MSDAPILAMQEARLIAGRLQFASDGCFDQALQDGCFYLDMPEGLDLAPLVRLARHFYLPNDPQARCQSGFQGFRTNTEIYFDREHFQTEHLLADTAQRLRHFPAQACASAAAMAAITHQCLCSVMEQLGIAQGLWDELTGGAAHGRGTDWFAISHYRPERAQLGCAPHQDTGFITLLYIDQDGLEAASATGWQSIAPKDGAFVVNFGAAFEHLTARSARPVKAILHRVRRCYAVPGREDRFSFAAFANPPATGDQFQLGPDGTPQRTGSIEAFLREFNAKTWGDSYEDFGIQ